MLKIEAKSMNIYVSTLPLRYVSSTYIFILRQDHTKSPSWSWTCDSPASAFLTSYRDHKSVSSLGKVLSRGVSLGGYSSRAHHRIRTDLASRKERRVIGISSFPRPPLTVADVCGNSITKISELCFRLSAYLHSLGLLIFDSPGELMHEV